MPSATAPAPYEKFGNQTYSALERQWQKYADEFDYAAHGCKVEIQLSPNAPADVVAKVAKLKRKMAEHEVKRNAPPPATKVKRTKPAPVIEAAPVVTPARKPKAIRKSAPVVSVAALSPTDRENVQRENVLRVVKPKAPPVQKSALVPPPLPKRKSDNVSQACAEYFGDVAKRVTSLLVQLAIASIRNRIEAAIGKLRKRVENLDKKLDA